MTYGNMATNGTSFTLTTTTGERPPSSPQGLIATRAVETKSGWLGQVYVDKKIVFESETAHQHSSDAIDEANALVVAKVSGLFA